jgi:hypothetical protein
LGYFFGSFFKDWIYYAGIILLGFVASVALYIPVPLVKR